MGSEIKVVIIDSGINGQLAQVVKCENKLIIDENNNCREDISKIQNINYLHGTICSLIIEKYCPECVFSSIRILNIFKKRTGKNYIYLRFFMPFGTMPLFLIE